MCLCGGRVYPPVRRLLFLQRRAQKSGLRNSAVLLSSQAGSVCWWSILCVLAFRLAFHLVPFSPSLSLSPSLFLFLQCERVCVFICVCVFFDWRLCLHGSGKVQLECRLKARELHCFHASLCEAEARDTHTQQTNLHLQSKGHCGVRVSYEKE